MRYLLLIILLAWAQVASAGTIVVGQPAAVAGGGTPPEYVNSNSGYNSGPVTINGVTAGNTLIAFVTGGGSLSGTTLSGWTALAAGGDGASFIRAYYILSSAGGNISVNITSPPGDPGWSVHEYSGVSAIGDSDVKYDASASTSHTSPTIDIAGDNEIIVGAVAEGVQASRTYTFDTANGVVGRTNQSAHQHLTFDDLTVSAGTYSTTWTSSGAALYNGSYIISLQGN